jgi:hypothetical protein
MPRAEDRSAAEIYDPEGYPACPFFARVAIHNARQMRDWRCRAS